ncbi:MAG: GMC family oxidoreductase N-terminal domain-containing protein [Proteobacteria bacterium]|nr:GMC family oxidoreductase N-terminal domain-containing protein [Pseudomonadota bacterium]
MKKKRPSLVEKAGKFLQDKAISRKEFGRWLLGAAGGAAAASTLGCSPPNSGTRDDNLEPDVSHDFEAVIVGSGFGGSVAAARLSKKWPNQVMMIERGRRYPRGSFPRDAASLVEAIRRDPGDHTPRPLPLPGKSNGLFDVRSYSGMDVLVANGYGGGSLIYGAALIEPSHPDFDRNWPATIKKDQLAPYYDIFKTVVTAGKIPITDEPERRLPRLDYYERVAQQTGGESKLLPLGVFFGNDPERPTPMGESEVNRHGVEQTSCVYCAECVLGCNYHAKSSTDLNYLHVAEHRYGMHVRTEQKVDRIVPLDSFGDDDPGQDGRYGYRVYMRDADASTGQPSESSATTRRVVLSAGVLGTTEILLRNKKKHRTLPRVSRQLGRHFSGNGDFLGLVVGSDIPDGNAHGPTVVQSILYNDPNRPEVSHVLEDMSLPHLFKVLDWLLDACEFNGPMYGFWKRIKDIITADGDDINSGFATQVFVGLDNSDGEFSLGWHGELRLNWSYWGSRQLYQAIIRRIEDVKRAVAGWAEFYLPTYTWPLRRNLTVHPLGGCALADHRYRGVTSAHRNNFGEVFGYTNLYVADGSLVPSAIGANPSLTISAFAEMVAEGITGIPATVDL